MRTILFRGKRVDTGEWVTGVPLVCDNWTLIVKYNEKEVDYLEEYKVNPATVGQATGLTDKHGKKIFEGDVVTFEDSDGGYEYQDTVINSGAVVYGDLGFYFTNRQAVEMDDFYIKNGKCEDIEIIGNIHDNPESLEGGTHDSP